MVVLVVFMLYGLVWHNWSYYIIRHYNIWHGRQIIHGQANAITKNVICFLQHFFLDLIFFNPIPALWGGGGGQGPPLHILIITHKNIISDANTS